MAKAVNNEASFKVTSDNGTINKMIDSVLKRGSKLMDDVHITNLSLLCLALDHGNVDPATRLVNGLGGGYRAASIAKWLQHYGPFKWVKDKDKDKYPIGGKFALDKERVEELRKEKETLIVKASEEPFWKFDPPKEFTGIDIPAMIASLIKRAESAAAEAAGDEAKGKKVNLKGLEQLRTLAKSL
jgi:hypothetical protein